MNAMDAFKEFLLCFAVFTVELGKTEVIKKQMWKQFTVRSRLYFPMKSTVERDAAIFWRVFFPSTQGIPCSLQITLNNTVGTFILHPSLFSSHLLHWPCSRDNICLDLSSVPQSPTSQFSMKVLSDKGSHHKSSLSMTILLSLRIWIWVSKSKTSRHKIVLEKTSHWFLEGCNP